MVLAKLKNVLGKLGSQVGWTAGARHAGRYKNPFWNVTGKGFFGTQLYCKLRPTANPMEETQMNKVMVLQGPERDQILQTAIDRGITAIMSYMSKGKWHVAKVLFTRYVDDRLYAETTRDDSKHRPVNIQAEQPVGISFKYEYGKFLFDTTVLDFQPSVESGRGGTIVLAVPDKIEAIQRRSYFRVNVPRSLRVNIVLWYRKGIAARDDSSRDGSSHSTQYFCGQLVDISAGGAQVVIDPSATQPPMDPKKGQFVGMRFTPLPYETPILINAQIRNVLPKADGDSLYLGLQFVGLEASPHGQQTLTRLVQVVEAYYKMNQAEDRQKSSRAPAVTTAD